MYMCGYCGKWCPKLTRHHIIAKCNGGKEVIQICEPCNSQLNTIVQREFSQMTKHGVSNRTFNTKADSIMRQVTSTVVFPGGSVYVENPLQIQASGNPIPSIWKSDYEDWYGISGTASSFAIVYITNV